MQNNKVLVFHSTCIVFWAIILTANSIELDLVKINKIYQWPRMFTGPQFASFLGLFNYYRNLVPSFAEASVPLYAVSWKSTIK